jgi:predicted DsbA family dithiol-disulfide isomerase
MPTLRIDVWSDIACPWCYVGKRRFEAALDRFEHAGDVELHWRSFELDPSAPKQLSGDVPYVERLAKKYGATAEHAQGMIDRMTETAKADGLSFRFDRIRPGNTFDAHRLVHLAAEHELQDAMKEAFFRAYLEEGVAIGDPEAIATVATNAGVDADAVQGVLQSDAFAADVRNDEQQAAALGIRGVPFFVLDRRFAIQGAQSADTVLSVLRKAHQEMAPLEVLEGAACGPDGC